MRILDENDNEIQESDVDTSLGYLQPDQVFVQHHDAVEAVEEVKHFEVETFYFDDNTSFTVEGNEDSHVSVIDQDTGIFDYIDQGEGKNLRGIDIREQIDQEAVAAKDAYDEYEDIQRYILYTEEQLAEQAAAKEKAEKQASFLENGPDQLEENTTNISDITVLLAEVIGVE